MVIKELLPAKLQESSNTPRVENSSRAQLLKKRHQGSTAGAGDHYYGPAKGRHEGTQPTPTACSVALTTYVNKYKQEVLRDFGAKECATRNALERYLQWKW